MIIKKSAYRAALLEAYSANPFGHNHFALWKVMALVEESQCFAAPGGDAYAVRGGVLVSHISPAGGCNIPGHVLQGLECFHLTARAYESIRHGAEGFCCDSYAILGYDFAYKPPSLGGGEYSVRQFDFSCGQDYALAAQLINQGGSWLGPQNVRNIAAQPAFAPDLWLFVQSPGHPAPIAVGIASHNPQVGETDLDYIYVDPAFHGRQAGRRLVGEIISRAAPRSQVIRVGGTVEFYKQCGFEEKQLWVCGRKPGFVFRAPCVQP